jgi:hypothetical protein
MTLDEVPLLLQLQQLSADSVFVFFSAFLMQVATTSPQTRRGFCLLLAPT